MMRNALRLRSRGAYSGLLCAALLLTMAITVNAQVTPLIVGTISPITDEFGEFLEGNSFTSPEFGHPYVAGDVVMLMSANFGIFPPTTNGGSHFANTLLHSTRIGDGMSGSLTNPAQFASSVVPRPNGQAVFVRIFNAPSMEEASFYSDSQIHLVDSDEDVLFIVNIVQTQIPLDANDDDGDGLHNSYEKSYGSDTSNSDSDNDGHTDYEEHLAGTNPTNDASNLAIEMVTTAGADLIFQWASVAGKRYAIELSTNLMDNGVDFASLSSEMTATGDTMQYTVTNAAALAPTCYRVRLAVP